MDALGAELANATARRQLRQHINFWFDVMRRGRFPKSVTAPPYRLIGPGSKGKASFPRRVPGSTFQQAYAQDIDLAGILSTARTGQADVPRTPMA